MECTEIEPYKRNISAFDEICELEEKKDRFIQLRREKQLELDDINSNISLIEAQIANILMTKRRKGAR